MDSHTRVIPLHLHPLGFIEAFTHFGADLDSLLRDTGVHQRLFDSRDARISYHQQTTLIRNGLDRCRQPGLGLLVGQYFDWSYHGAVGAVVHCSPSLRHAGEAFRRYQMIAQPWYAICPRRPGSYMDQNGLIVDPLQCFPGADLEPALQRFELEFRLAVALRIWDLCGNKSVADTAVRVCLEHPEPPYAHLYRSLPCSSVQFGCAQSSIAAHRSYVSEPFREFRRFAFNRLIERCEDELRKANLESSYTAKVRWHVYARFNRQLSLDKIAAILGMTPRALMRRLAAERATFRDIVHDVRMELASHHLRSSRLSVDEIAELMGFSCASSLRRAIRNWTGDRVGAMRPPAPDGAAQAAEKRYAHGSSPA